MANLFWHITHNNLPRYIQSSLPAHLRPLPPSRSFSHLLFCAMLASVYLDIIIKCGGGGRLVLLKLWQIFEVHLNSHTDKFAFYNMLCKKIGLCPRDSHLFALVSNVMALRSSLIYRWNILCTANCTIIIQMVSWA